MQLAEKLDCKELKFTPQSSNITTAKYKQLLAKRHMTKLTWNELENYKRETFFRKTMCYINKAINVNFKLTLDKLWR
jgi:hypothetical protein